MDKISTSERLKQIMFERNLKQVDILEKVNPLCREFNEKINKSHLSQWISGKNEPNQRKLTILSMALNVNEPYLMGYDVQPDRVNLSDPVTDAEISNDSFFQKIAFYYLQLTPEEKKEVCDYIMFKFRNHDNE